MFHQRLHSLATNTDHAMLLMVQSLQHHLSRSLSQHWGFFFMPGAPATHVGLSQHIRSVHKKMDDAWPLSSRLHTRRL